MYYDLGKGGRGWSKVSWARYRMGADAYLCCPGPSLKPVPRGRGRKIFAINTAYPKVVPDIWMGLDRVECYDRNVWGESFYKVCRGNYTDMKVENRLVKYFDNVFFASIKEPEKGKTLFDYLDHVDPLVWHKNTMASMLHLIIKMGAKTIYLVGCDMGGKDYYDDRVLDKDERNTNQQLYKEQVNWIKSISIIANAKGITLVSTTPNSPLNEFLPFKDLDIAIRESEEKVRVLPGPILHCLEAEELYKSQLAESERELYKTLWDNGDYKSQCAKPFVEFLKSRLNKTDKVLEIGSGDGTTLFGLNELGFNVIGSDIYATHEDIVECPAWQLPFGDESFDYVISTDVLEHLPTEMVEETIKKIQRIGKKQIHIIACWADRQRVEGEVVHKTVRPIAWWKEKFSKDALIIDRDDFMGGKYAGL